MAEELAQHWLHRMPEIGILRDVARASGESVRIRGGVPRNLLARAMRPECAEAPAPAHLVDLVDPLSDIDIVVSKADKIPYVLGLIFRRIALAGFTRWEGKTSAQVSRFEQQGALTSLDGVEIEIKAEGARLTRTEGAVRDLEDRRLRGRFHLERTQSPQDITDIDVLLFALRAVRFAVEFGIELDDELASSIQNLGPRRQGLITELDALRVELAVLDVILTAPTSTDASRGLRRVFEIVPGWIRQQSRILMQLSDSSLDRPLRVIALPRLGAQPPRVLLETDLRQNAAITEETLLPWTAIRVPRFANGACCPPDDFMLGPLVIAWRGRELPTARIGVVALAPPADPYDAPGRLVFGVPGIVTAGPTVVQRLDWGFVRYLAGDGRLVYIGARSVIAPEVDE